MQTSIDASRRALAAAAACAVGFGATWLLFVRTSAGQWLDGELLPRAERGGYAQPTVLLEPAQLVLNRFGNPLLIGLTVLGLVLGGLLTHRVRAAVAALALFGGAVGVAGLAKQVIIRPELGVVGSSTHNSFPSGHVTAAIALLLAFLLVVPARVRWVVAVPGTTGVSVVAAATMIVGWHRFSDVVGSLLLAGAVFFLAAAGLARWPDKHGEPDPDHSSGTGLLALACGATLLMMVLLAFATDAGVPLLAATAAVSVLAMLLVGAAIHLTRPVDPATGLENTEPPRAYVHPGRL
ncbi:phosphatase PAP2 family protein [Asanoa sp. NPDC049573]|uniref:phosphatase PAP2 family protein n=1 Tax=Asanoa sp. NPDC049573 TaxID=3155396 RepID=UPI0034495E46